MGDVVACLPVAESHSVDKKVIWVVNNRYSSLIDSVPYISKVITIYCIATWSRICLSLKKEDVADLHFQNRYCASCNIYHERYDFDSSVDEHNYYHHGSLLESFCKHAKIAIPKIRQPSLIISKSSRVEHLLPKGDTPYVVIHTKSNETSRDWCHNEWKRLLETLIARFGISVVEIGNQETEISKMKGVLSLATSRLELSETAEVIQKARLFIGIDSGPAHIANAFRVPSIILLGKYRAFDNYMPYAGFFEDSQNALILRFSSSLKDVKFEIFEDQAVNFLEARLK